MANYPQLDNASGVWNLREVYDAVMGGYWPNANSNAFNAGGDNGAILKTIETSYIFGIVGILTTKML